MRALIAVAAAVALLVTGCKKTAGPEDAKNETAERKKTTAEEAFEAGQNAKRKAEQIKSDAEKKANEAVESTTE